MRGVLREGHRGAGLPAVAQVNKPRVMTALEGALSIPRRLDELERDVDGLRHSAEFIGKELVDNELRDAAMSERLARIEAMLGIVYVDTEKNA